MLQFISAHSTAKYPVQECIIYTLRTICHKITYSASSLISRIELFSSIFWLWEHVIAPIQGACTEFPLPFFHISGLLAFVINNHYNYRSRSVLFRMYLIPLCRLLIVGGFRGQCGAHREAMKRRTKSSQVIAIRFGLNFNYGFVSAIGFCSAYRALSGDCGGVNWWQSCVRFVAHGQS